MRYGRRWCRMRRCSSRRARRRPSSGCGKLWCASRWRRCTRRDRCRAGSTRGWCSRLPDRGTRQVVHGTRLRQRGSSERGSLSLVGALLLGRSLRRLSKSARRREPRIRTLVDLMDGRPRRAGLRADRTGGSAAARGLRNSKSTGNGRGNPGSAGSRPRGQRSQHAASIGKACCGQPLGRRRNWARATHHRSRHSSDGALIDVLINARPVSCDLGYAREVANVGSIDLLEISLRYRIVRHVDLARAERDPCTRVLRSEERYQGGRIDRHDSLADRFVNRHPGPAIIDKKPTAIMEWREPPWLIVKPGPAPRLDPRPISVAVGRPARRDVGVPDLAVTLGASPMAIGTKFRGASYGRCYRRGTRAAPLFLRLHPGHECICRGCGPDVPANGLLPGQDCCLSGAHLKIHTFPADMRAAIEDGDLGGMLGIPRNDLVSTCGSEDHAPARNLDPVGATLRERPERDEHCSLWQRELRRLIIEYRHVKLGRTVQVDPVACHIERGVRAGLRPEGLASRDRIVAPCDLPVVLVRRMIGHRAINERDATNSSWWILHRILRAGCAARQKGASQRDQNSERRQARFAR
jgi:hypothetical protein